MKRQDVDEGEFGPESDDQKVNHFMMDFSLGSVGLSERILALNGSLFDEASSERRDEIGSLSQLLQVNVESELSCKKELSSRVSG